MFPKTIGIIGGAGPMAGVRLAERIFYHAGKKYGCHNDGDFPKLILLSFPFSDMLSPSKDAKLVTKELTNCFRQLRKNDAKVLAIACNTLHAFLDKRDDKEDLVHLPRTLAELNLPGKPLVLCTSTSAQFGLHRRFLPCSYPLPETQKKVDHIIDEILKGKDQLAELDHLIRKEENDTFILGCTELSLFTEKLLIPGKQVIDPLELVALKVLEKSFTH